MQRMIDIEQRLDNAVAKNPGKYRHLMSKILSKQNDWQDASNRKDRIHIGASSIGATCKRAVKLKWQGAVPPESLSGNKIRLFQQGHMAEAIIIAMLKLAGFPVAFMKDGKQIGWDSDVMSGDVDGVVDVDGKIMLLECKTVSEKKLIGVEKSGPQEQYIKQANINMYHMGLTDCMMVFLCRGNSQIIIWRLSCDEADALRSMDIARKLVFDNSIPPAIGGKTYYACKFCECYQMCHEGIDVLKTCRNCVHHTAVSHKFGVCHLGADVTIFGRGEACESWEKQ